MENFSRLFFHLCFVLALFMSSPAIAWGGSDFVALAFHDVVDDRDELTADTVTYDNLIDYFEWLRYAGYHPVSIDDLIADRDGVRALPEKAVLLCWDDGYASFYTHVFPLLRAYRFPAVLALVGQWLEPSNEGTVMYGDKLVPRDNFVTWEQLREITASGLIEIASHSYDLHTGVAAGPEGWTMPASITLRYDPATQKRESETAYKARIINDLKKNNDLIQQRLGVRPRVMVWPFGRYNAMTMDAATKTGMPITLTLDPVAGNSANLQTIHRKYPQDNPDLRAFRAMLSLHDRPPITHFIRVDSKDLQEPVIGQEQSFSRFLNRVKALNPNMVAFSPVTEDGGKVRAFFANNRFPVSQDRLNRLTWHTGKRTGSDVFLWLSSRLFETRAGEQAKDVSDFFSKMAASSYGQAGLIIEYPDFIKALITDQAQHQVSTADLRYWQPVKRQVAREALRKTGVTGPVARVLDALAAFQQWQPFTQVGQVVSLEVAETLSKEQLDLFFSLFDFMMIDARSTSSDELDQRFGAGLTVLRQADYLNKCFFLFTVEGDGAALSRTLFTLPKYRIINWGYQFDRFLEDQPSSQTLVPLLSKKRFPYPLPD